MLKRNKIERIKDAEKIAAGEVIERPANVVKELVENSIDAGAKEIRIIVKNAGKSSIQVIDDGIGIPPDEIELAFGKHMSSKIRSIDDLNTLHTLGFRGEAMTSINAVSQVEIISKTEQNDSGVRLVFDGGTLIERKEISFPVGTSLKVKNLFYNIPARQKFLKSDATELGHITDVVQRYSLAYPEIHFLYRHNDIDILNCPSGNLLTTIFHMYGKSTAKLVEPINYLEETPLFKIYGLLGHPQISKKKRMDSSIFVNRRYIISDLLFDAIQEAYKGILTVGKFPFFVLNVVLNPSIIDFNIHPKKLHIRFENETYVYNKVYNIVRNFVEDKYIAKGAKYLSTELNDYISHEACDVEEKSFVDSNVIEKPIKAVKEKIATKEKPNDLLNEEGELIDKTVQLRLTDQNISNEINESLTSDTYIREKYVNFKNFPKLRLISNTGQLINKIYVVLEGFHQETNEPGLYVLDQHAASERINKEKLQNMLETSNVKRQALISPLKMELIPSEKFFLIENLEEINNFGFKFEHFGGNSFILREIPTIMEKTPNIEVIQEIISDISEIGKGKDKSFSEVKEEIINYLACHKSIRGGDELSIKDIRNLIMELANCKDPFHCAHGRPTLKFISFKELDKIFKRKM